MQFNYSIRETIESILRNPEVHEKSCFFSGLSSHYSGGCQSLVRWKDFKEVSKDLPLLVAGNESLFVWYDHDDIRQFLDIAIDVRGWDSSHDVVRVLKCLESSSREWGHRIPRSFVKRLEDDLLHRLSVYKSRGRLIQDRLKEISLRYFSFVEETSCDDLIRDLDSFFMSRKLQKISQWSLDYYLENGFQPDSDLRRRELVSMGYS